MKPFIVGEVELVTPVELVTKKNLDFVPPLALRRRKKYNIARNFGTSHQLDCFLLSTAARSKGKPV